MPSPLPWERQADEPDTSFAGFQVYRDQPPGQRSIRRVATQLDRGQTTIDGYSSTYHWVERARAWDDHVARQGAISSVEASVEASTRLHEDARRLQSIGRVALDGFLERDAEGRVIGVRKVRPQDAIAMLKTGAQFEQEAVADVGDAFEIEFVMNVADAFAAAFVEVNDLDSPTARLAAFAECSRAALARLLPSASDGGPPTPT